MSDWADKMQEGEEDDWQEQRSQRDGYPNNDWMSEREREAEALITLLAGDILGPQSHLHADDMRGKAVDMNGTTQPPEPTKELARYADKAMFTAEPLAGSDGPAVYVLAMNPDPLGAAAAAIAMYRGQVITDLAQVTDDQRREVLTSMRATKLKAPLEFIKLHLLLENVHRGFTHQMVRQRTAVYAQESMRFAVKEGMANAIHLPPSLARFNDPREVAELEARLMDDSGFLYPANLTDQEEQFLAWRQTANAIEQGYNELINRGMPAEEARGLAPTNIGTRLHYATDFRALLEHAGNRLCTQAQFEWRQVFSRIASALVEFGKTQHYFQPASWKDGPSQIWASAWQFEELAAMFRPACYLTGKCEFAAMDLDRACKIRNRVDANQEAGRASDVWDVEYDVVEGDPIVSGVGPKSVVRDEKDRPVFIGAIYPAEWLLDDSAARER